MTKRRVVITGMGIMSPVGNDVQTAWKNITAGISGVGRISLFDASDMKSQIAGEVRDFDPVEAFGKREARRMDRYTQLALAAAQQAVEDSRLKVGPTPAERIATIIGTGIGGFGTLVAETTAMTERGESRFVSPFLIPMMLPDTAPGKIAIDYGFRGPNFAISTACASATNAIGEATATIQRGAADVVVAGGSEASIVEIAVAGFANMGALSSRNDDPEAASRPFEAERDGFVTGEGAAILILEELEHATARGATIYAEVLGYGSSADAYHITAPMETGEGAQLAMEAALEDAGLTVKDIGYLNAHGTSTPLNDSSETEAIKRTFGEHAYDVAVSSTKSMTGHLLGAAGAVEAVFTVQALRHQLVPPTINYETPDPTCDLYYVPNDAEERSFDYAMSNSFGFGGHNASIILGRYKNGS